MVAHELAHAWSGGSVGPGDGWVVEAVATYMSCSALGELIPGFVPWPATRVAPDDGYYANARTLRDLEGLVGREVVMADFRGLVGGSGLPSITADTLVRHSSEAASINLGSWAESFLAMG